jgi:hypothetical protein
MQQTYPTIQVHENQCIRLTGEFHVVKQICVYR